MNVDWSKAPEWAQWVALDHDGDLRWHEFEPEFDGFVWDSPGRSLVFGEFSFKEQRP